MKIISFLAAWLLGSAVMATPASGPAPNLAFTDLLQAPEGAKTDWPSLRGKAVVINFWATWCVPCVAEIPLMNSLAASTDPARVQFIAADYNGEDRKKIEAFLKKHPMSAWIGLDTTRETQRGFDIHAVPVTLIVGPDGKIVHVTDNPQSLTAEQLTKLADGKKVAFGGEAKTDAKLLDQQKQAAAQAEQDKLASFKATNGRRLAATPDGTITLSEAARAPDDGLPAALARTMIWKPGRFDLLSARPADLAAQLGHTDAARVTVSGIGAGKRYNLHVDRPGMSPRALDRAIGRILSAGLGVTIKHETRATDVVLLATTEQTPSHLDPAPPAAEHSCYFLPIPPDQGVICDGGSLGDLAGALEETLNLPVLPETTVAGTITAKLAMPSTDFPLVADILTRDLGLSLTAAKRPVEMIVVKRSKQAS